MVFAIGVTLAFIFLDWPWRLVVIGVLGAIEIFEILLWLRLRRIRSITGPESLLGATGRAISDLDPSGQVRVKGAIWKARSRTEVRAGDDVVVTSMDGMELEVQRR